MGSFGVSSVMGTVLGTPKMEQEDENTKFFTPAATQASSRFTALEILSPR